MTATGLFIPDPLLTPTPLPLAKTKKGYNELHTFQAFKPCNNATERSKD